MPRIHSRRPSAALFGLLVLGACAQGSPTADREALNGAQRPAEWNGTITLASDPSGAACTVSSDGNEVARIASTPGQVQLARGNSPAIVRCAAAGRIETMATLRPLRDFGVHHHQPTGPRGAIEHARDLDTGRVRRFFDVTVALPPATFPTAEARDAWFADRATAIRAAWAPFIAQAERSSAATIDTAQTLRGYLAEDLAALDRQKAAATIGAATRGRR